MSKKLFSLSLILIISFFHTDFALSAVKPKVGTTCKVKEQIKTSNSGRIICAKKGNKLIWKLLPAVKAPSPAENETKTEETKTVVTETQNPVISKPFVKDPKYKVQGENCTRNSGDVIGYDVNNILVYLMCNNWDDKYFPRPDAPKIDQETLVPFKSEMGSINPSIAYVSPKSITGSPKTQITEADKFTDLSKCKIKDGSYYRVTPNYTQRHFTVGFPNYPERANFLNKGIMQIVPVDFPDLQGKKSPSEDLAQVSTFMTEYFTRQASRSVDFKIRIPEKYIRMPKNVIDYELAVDFFSGKWKADSSFAYAREAIKIADEYIDFTGASMIAITVPAEVSRSQIAAFVAQAGEPGQQFITNEGEIFNLLIMAGPTGGLEGEILNWTHETAHLFGLTDIRSVVDVSKQDSSDLGVFDLMNSGIAPELLGWQRFILGILEDKQVRCVSNVGKTFHHIIPIAQPELLPKLIVIPINDFKALAIESRRRHGYDLNLGSRNEGIIVYEIDTTIPYGRSAIKLIPSPTSKDSTWRRDSALLINEYVEASGWKISYIESGDYGDVVQVERLSK